ncbi:hypothetical protein F0726_01727 [Acidithiobacillus caldus]|nr:hypothetical protein F0726_01727 [Acidithiobacillus caldus]
MESASPFPFAFTKPVTARSYRAAMFALPGPFALV